MKVFKKCKFEFSLVHFFSFKIFFHLFFSYHYKKFAAQRFIFTSRRAFVFFTKFFTKFEPLYFNIKSSDRFLNSKKILVTMKIELESERCFLKSNKHCCCNQAWMLFWFAQPSGKVVNSCFLRTCIQILVVSKKTVVYFVYTNSIKIWNKTSRKA